MHHTLLVCICLSVGFAENAAEKENSVQGRCEAQIYKPTDPIIKIRRGPDSCNSAIKERVVLKGHLISSSIRRRNVKKAG